MSYITEDQFKKAIEHVNNKIDDIADNHLNSIEAAILWIVRDIERLWKVMGIGIAVLALVIALVG